MRNSGRGGWTRCEGWGKKGNESGLFMSRHSPLPFAPLYPDVTMSTTRVMSDG